jgi:hypothetical protein
MKVGVKVRECLRWEVYEVWSCESGYEYAIVSNDR